MTVTEYPEYVQTKEFHSGVEIETNFHVEDTTRMSVDAHGAAHIMSLLTDLYSDPAGSVIREYISNAYDSHAAAGQTLPIEVSLPGPFDTTFVVQDFGTGMSASEVREIYGSYGRSTKRDRMDQVGAFGLGCKSALTMTQQFTLIAVKDGLKSVSIIARGEDGVGEIKMIASEQPTDEPNGVTVKIPVKDFRSFNEKAEQFFFALPKDSILINGNPPKKSMYDADLMQIPSLKAYISRNPERRYSSANRFSVIMGGVLYVVDVDEISTQFSTDLHNSAFYQAFMGGIFFPLYAEIPVASLDLTPSREAIRYSDRSRKFLVALLEKIHPLFVQMVAQDVAEAETRAEAVKRIFHYSTVIHLSRLSEVTWNGETIPVNIGVDGQAIYFRERLQNTSIEDLFQIHLPDYVDLSTPVYYVEGPEFDTEADDYDEEAAQEVWDKFIKGVRRDFRGWRTQNNHPGKTLHVYEGKAPNSPWYSELGVFEKVELADLAADAKEWRKERRAAGARNRAAGAANGLAPITYPFFLLKDDGNDLEIGDIAASELSDDDIYIESGIRTFFDRAFDYMYSYRAEVAERIKDLNLYNRRIVYIAAPRKVDAFLSRTKGKEVTSYSSIEREICGGYFESLSEEDLSYFTSLSWSWSFDRFYESVKMLEPYLNEIGDLDLSALVNKVSSLEPGIAMFKRMSKIHSRVEVTSALAEVKIKAIEDKYPLLDFSEIYRYTSKTLEHAVFYMKAINSSGKDA